MFQGCLDTQTSSAPQQQPHQQLPEAEGTFSSWGSQTPPESSQPGSVLARPMPLGSPSGPKAPGPAGPAAPDPQPGLGTAKQIQPTAQPRHLLNLFLNLKLFHRLFLIKSGVFSPLEPSRRRRQTWDIRAGTSLCDPCPVSSLFHVSADPVVTVSHRSAIGSNSFQSPQPPQPRNWFLLHPNAAAGGDWGRVPRFPCPLRLSCLFPPAPEPQPPQCQPGAGVPAVPLLSHQEAVKGTPRALSHGQVPGAAGGSARWGHTVPGERTRGDPVCPPGPDHGATVGPGRDAALGLCWGTLGTARGSRLGCPVGAAPGQDRGGGEGPGPGVGPARSRARQRGGRPGVRTAGAEPASSRRGSRAAGPGTARPP